MDKNEPSVYKCWKPGGFYHKEYRYGLEETLSCCRNTDFCNLEFPSASPGGPPQPRLFPEASSSDEPGQRGGEGKASISPASLPDIILESCETYLSVDKWDIKDHSLTINAGSLVWIMEERLGGGTCVTIGFPAPPCRLCTNHSQVI